MSLEQSSGLKIVADSIHQHAEPTSPSRVGSNWVTLPFFLRQRLQHGAMTIIARRLASLVSSSSPRKVSASEEYVYSNDLSYRPENIHDNSTFLVKLQLCRNPQNNPEVGNRILVHDYHRSIQVYLLESANAELFERVRNEMESPRGGYKGLKMYRWARRTADFELSICLDNRPKGDVMW